MSSPAYDVFLSYAHRSEREFADALEPALTALGLRVFRDIREIDDFDSIARRLQDALTRSRTLVALYSPTYPTRRGCQWELTSAYIACEQRGIDPVERLLVVNVAPDQDDAVGHILPETLRVQSIHGPDDRTTDEIAEAVAARLTALDGTCFGDRENSDGAPANSAGRLGAPRVLPALRTGSEHFVGRLPEMWRIHGALRGHVREAMGGRVAPAITHLAGMGGMGKSLLAEEYALRFHAAYPGGVLWISLDGVDAGVEGARSNASTALHNAADQLGIDTHEKTLGRIKAEVQDRLLSEGPFLAVLDDLPLRAPRELIDELTFPDPRVAHLITTRSSTYGSSIVGDRVSLETLPRDEARRLLASHGGIDEDDPITDAIAEKLGGHALALDVAGAYLALTRDPQAFLAHLESPSDDVMELSAELSETLPNEHEASVALTLLASVEHLSNEANMVLEAAAMLSTADMPVELIQRVLAEDRGGEVPAAAVLKGLTGSNGLRDHSLAVQNQESGTWAIHGLVGRVVTHHLLSEERRSRLRLAALAALTALIYHHLHMPRAPLLDAALAHGHVLSIAGDDEQALETAAGVALAEHERGDFGTARRVEEHVLEARTRLLGKEHPDTLTSMANLANTLWAQGELEGAQQLQERVLEALARILGDEHRHTLICMGNLANTLRARGDLAGARLLGERVLETRTHILGEEHPDTLHGMGNLARTLRAQGDLASARQLQERVLEARARILGEEHPDALTNMGNLARTLWTQGDFAGARQLQERVIETRARILGEDHPDTLLSMSDLAETLQSRGDLASAQQLEERVLGARARILGEGHPDTLVSMRNLAGTLRAQGDSAGARQLEEQLDAAHRRAGAGG